MMDLRSLKKMETFQTPEQVAQKLEQLLLWRGQEADEQGRVATETLINQALTRFFPGFEALQLVTKQLTVFLVDDENVVDLAFGLTCLSKLAIHNKTTLSQCHVIEHVIPLLQHWDTGVQKQAFELLETILLHFNGDADTLDRTYDMMVNVRREGSVECKRAVSVLLYQMLLYTHEPIIIDRFLNHASWLLRHGDSVDRIFAVQCFKQLSISHSEDITKSLVLEDLTPLLKHDNKELARNVFEVLLQHVEQVIRDSTIMEEMISNLSSECNLVKAFSLYFVTHYMVARYSPDGTYTNDGAHVAKISEVMMELVQSKVSEVLLELLDTNEKDCEDAAASALHWISVKSQEPTATNSSAHPMPGDSSSSQSDQTKPAWARKVLKRFSSNGGMEKLQQATSGQSSGGRHLTKKGSFASSDSSGSSQVADDSEALSRQVMTVQAFLKSRQEASDQSETMLPAARPRVQPSLTLEHVEHLRNALAKVFAVRK